MDQWRQLGPTGGQAISATPYGHLHSIGLWCVPHRNHRDFNQIFWDFVGYPIVNRSSISLRCETRITITSRIIIAMFRHGKNRRWRSVLASLTGLPRFRDFGQIVGEDPPAHPMTHPPLPVIAAPLQTIIPTKNVAPSLDPRSEPVPTTERTSLLQGLPICRRLAHLRQGDLLDTGLTRQLFIGRRRHPPVGRQHVGSAAEVTAMRVQAVLEVWLVLTTTLREDGLAGNDPSLHLDQANLATELDGLAGLESGHHLSVRLEQRQRFLRGGHQLPLEDSPGRLLKTPAKTALTRQNE